MIKAILTMPSADVTVNKSSIYPALTKKWLLLFEGTLIKIENLPIFLSSYENK